MEIVESHDSPSFWGARHIDEPSEHLNYLHFGKVLENLIKIG